MPCQCALSGIQQGKNKPREVPLTEARTITTFELEVLHLLPVSSLEQASGTFGERGRASHQGGPE
jgi:hypothetical protein